MEYTLTFSAFIAGLIVVGWWLVRRQFSKADKDAEQKDGEIHASFEKLHATCDSFGTRIRDIEVALEKRVTREELERAVDGIRTEMREGFRQLRDDLRTFLNKA